jgi:hypothetical protein
MIPFRAMFSISLATCVSGVIGCNKTGDVGASKESPLLSEAMLRKLPQSTAGFTALDLSGESYKLLRASPFNSPTNAKKSFDAFVEKVKESASGVDQSTLARQLALAEKAYEALVRLGVVSSDGIYTPERFCSKVVGFVGPVDQDKLPLDLGFFAEGKSGTDMTEKLGIVRSFFAESGIAVTQEKFGSADGIISSLEGAPAKLYIAATKSHLAAAIRKSDIDGFFSNTETGTLNQLKNEPEFKKATASLPVSKNTITFTYASIVRMRPLLARIAALNEDIAFEPNNVPVESIAGQTEFSSQYSARLNIAVAPRTESQSKVSAAFASGSLPTAVAKLPANTALAISLDTKGVTKLDFLLDPLQNGRGAELVLQVKKLTGLTIGVRNNTGGSPVPDIFISADSQNRDELGKLVESSLGTALSMTGESTKWMSKEIDGNSTRYFTTLIGAGVYMSYPKNSNSLLVGTSENVIRDVIAADTGKAQTLSTSLTEPQQAQFKSYNLASAYFNFSRLGDLVDSVKSTLAMFTGGNTELNQVLNSAKLRNFGVGVGGVSYEGGVVSLESNLQPPSSK